MNATVEDYFEIKEQAQCSDTAAAIILLSEAIRESATFGRSNAENFGHELALALKNVLQESKIRIESNDV
jgi:hypothetical protein